MLERTSLGSISLLWRGVWPGLDMSSGGALQCGPLSGVFESGWDVHDCGATLCTDVLFWRVEVVGCCPEAGPCWCRARPDAGPGEELSKASPCQGGALGTTSRQPKKTIKRRGKHKGETRD